MVTTLKRMFHYLARNACQRYRSIISDTVSRTILCTGITRASFHSKGRKELVRHFRTHAGISSEPGNFVVSKLLNWFKILDTPNSTSGITLVSTGTLKGTKRDWQNVRTDRNSKSKCFTFSVSLCLSVGTEDFCLPLLQTHFQNSWGMPNAIFEIEKECSLSMPVMWLLRPLRQTVPKCLPCYILLHFTKTWEICTNVVPKLDFTLMILKML